MQATCVNCKAVFPANRELATIPDASRIAFDPAHRRVWRICAKCGEWNLLGAEASERALPELEARFAAAPKRAGGEGFAPAHVGSALELLRIGKAVVAVNDAVLRKRRRQLAMAKSAWIVGLSAMGLMLLALGIFFYRDGRLLVALSSALFYGSVHYLTRAVMQHRRSVPFDRNFVALAIFLGVAGFVTGAVIEHWFVIILILPALLIGFAMNLKLGPPSLLTLTLAGGKVVRFYSRKQLKSVSMSWSADGVLTLHSLPGGVEAHGADAETALRSLVHGGNIIMARRATSDAAYDLVRTAGGLPGVLRALEGFHDDNSERVVLADLPKVYLVALDLALAKRELGDPSDDDGAIAEQSARAAAIAAEAEALDQTTKEPAA